MVGLGNAKVEGNDSVSHLGFLVIMVLIFWTGLFYFCFGHAQDAGWCWQRLYDFVSVVTFHLLYSYRCREHIYNLRWILEHLGPLPRKAGWAYLLQIMLYFRVSVELIITRLELAMVQEGIVCPMATYPVWLHSSLVDCRDHLGLRMRPRA